MSDYPTPPPNEPGGYPSYPGASNQPGYPQQPVGSMPTPPAGYGQQPGYGAGAAGPRNGLGLAAMILGIVSIPTAIFLLGVIPAILAVIFGFIGRSRAKRQEATNGGQALAGVILGALGVVVAVVIVTISVHRFHRDCVNYGNGDIRCDSGAG